MPVEPLPETVPGVRLPGVDRVAIQIENVGALGLIGDRFNRLGRKRFGSETRKESRKLRPENRFEIDLEFIVSADACFRMGFDCASGGR